MSEFYASLALVRRNSLPIGADLENFYWSWMKNESSCLMAFGVVNKDCI